MAKRKARKNAIGLAEPPAAPRNPYATHPLMTKGGIHEKSKTSLRSKVRRETKLQARDWAS